MKKIFAVSLAIMLLLALCACGEGENAPSGTTTLPSTTLPIPTTSNCPPTQEAEALQIGKELLGKYLWYGALGVCCDTEYVEGDMSAYLSDTQKDLYIGSQHKITCCKNEEEVNSHLHKLFSDRLITSYPEDLLFSDDAGNLYVIIYPTGMPSYQNHRIVSCNDSFIVMEADSVEVGEVDGTAKITCAKTSDGYILEEFEYTPAQTQDLTEEGAEAIATRLLGSFVWYNAVGTCCELEYCEGDMSEFLSDSQRAEYIGSQQRIVCCNSAEDVHAHIDATFDPTLFVGYPDRLLFHDNEGNFYIIIYPTSLERFGNVRITLFNNNMIQAEADGLDYDDTVLYTVRITCENVDGNWLLTKYE